MRRGYTLIELSFVLAILAALTAATVPTYELIMRRARAAEPRGVVQAIAHAELRHFRDRGGYLACEATGDLPTTPVPFPNAVPCWRELGVQMTGDVRYRYEVRLDGDSYVVTAEGDLDQDGVIARFTLSGRDLALSIEDELE